MPVLQVNHLTKSYGDLDLLQDISLVIEQGERVGLVGRNGCGKTTLLRLLAGLEKPDRGQILLTRGTTAGLFSQLPDPEQDQEMVNAFLAEGQALDTLWPLLQPGSFPVLASQPGLLSGGERTRLALCCYLASQPDLLLLDEPTNNLDTDGIHMVIDLLQASPASMIIVSHDRYFLDQTVSRILEIESGRITSYEGHYSAYRDTKARLYEERLHRYEAGRRQERQLQQAIVQKQQWADKAHRDSTKKDNAGITMGKKEYFRAKAGKMAKKAKNDIRRLERLREEREDKPVAEQSWQFAFNNQDRHGRRILEAYGLGKSYDGIPLFADSNFHILRGERVALFGPNGCGKSTLIRMITGSETADQGRLLVSASSQPTLMEQILAELPPSETLQGWLTGQLGRLTGQDRATLAQLGFSSHHLQLSVSCFSPGERMKIRLAELILSRQDFLIMDEPTNFLDLPAREQLESALAARSGTLLIVSHDLYLLRRICDKVLLMADGRIIRLDMSFAEFMDRGQAIRYNHPVSS